MARRYACKRPQLRIDKDDVRLTEPPQGPDSDGKCPQKKRPTQEAQLCETMQKGVVGHKGHFFCELILANAKKRRLTENHQGITPQFNALLPCRGVCRNFRLPASDEKKQDRNDGMLRMMAFFQPKRA